MESEAGSRRHRRHRTLTGVATEKGAAEYAQWWTSKARQRPSQLEAITEYWDASSRRLAMQMRLRRTFEEVTAEIMKDQAAFLDILSRPRPSAKQRTSEGYNPPEARRPSFPGRPPLGARPAPDRAKGSGTRGGAASREGAERASPGAPAVRGQPGQRRRRLEASVASPRRVRPAARPAGLGG